MLDPAALKPFQVIHVYYEYQAQAGDYKYFVVLCHEKFGGQDYVLCLKATSRTEKYENDKERMNGCVFYKENEVPCFREKTAIQPDNIHPIPYDHLIEQEKRQRYSEKGMLPADFGAKLSAAVRASRTLTKKKKQEILARLGEKL